MATHRAVTSPSECGAQPVAPAGVSAMTVSTTRPVGGANAAAQVIDGTRLEPSTLLKPVYVSEGIRNSF